MPFPVHKLVVAALLLTACGGGEENVDDTRKTTLDVRPSPNAYSAYVSQSQTMFDVWDNLAIQAPINLPNGGGASYDGVMKLSLEASGGDVSMAGSLSLNVSFSNNTVAGSISNLVDAQEQLVSGNLDISNGTIDRFADTQEEFTVNADIDGTLITVDDTFVVNAFLGGDFYGAQEQAIVGAVQGQAVSGIGQGYVFGEFVAEQ